LGLEEFNITFDFYFTKLKVLISIFLCAAFLLQPLSKLSLLVNYELNKATITKNFCVNKSKPMLHCNGKCHLKKQLEKEDKKEETPTSSKEKSEIQFYSAPASTAFIAVSSTISHNTIYIVTYPDAPRYAIFHPPALS
jgi:hypothetical protein